MTTIAPGTPRAAVDAPSHRHDAAKVVGAMLLLLVAYLALSFLNDPRGTLGTDTGGKLATVAVMNQEGHALDPDIGYWAEQYDPTGSLHPLWYTSHVGDRWVNLTTLPMPIAARPLFALGGPRAVLVLPMLGAALAALAARALARRVTGGDGWLAFWVVGLASPIAIYALDFWEHAPGVAFVLWGLVFLWDLADQRAGWRGALASGALFGAAATMRTESLVYAVVGVGVTGLVLVAKWARTREPTWSWMTAVGVAWAGGIAIVLATNQMLERAALGRGIRSARAAGTAETAGVGLSVRGKEALTTAIGLNRFEPHTDWLFGALTVALVMYGAWRCTTDRANDRLLGFAALGAAAFLYVMRFADGLGFVPGVLSASPLAAAGLAIGWAARRWRISGAIALLAAPLVWLFQFTGGANPQWAGRYLLVTGTLLVVGGAIVLGATSGAGRVVLVGLAVFVTAAGFAWLSQRSHTVADAMRSLETPANTVLVSREAHLLREGGAFYSSERRWLTAVTDRDLRRAASVAEESGAEHLQVVAARGRGEPRTIGSYERSGRRTIDFLPGFPVTVVIYDRSAA